MENRPKYIEIIENGNQIQIIFSGNLGNRADFLDTNMDYLISRFSLKYIHSNVFIKLLHEITKNIYDHAFGMGKITITENDKYINFLVVDGNEIKVDLRIVQKRGYSTGKPENHNKGIGILMIKELATPRHNIFDFKRDTSKGGITYSGKFKKVKSTV